MESGFFCILPEAGYRKPSNYAQIQGLYLYILQGKTPEISDFRCP